MFSMDHPEIVRALIEKGANVNAKYPETGESVLMLMVLGDYLENVKSVLAGGADVNARDDHGNSALILAAANNKLEFAKALLEKGADVNAKAHNGETPLSVAKQNGFSKMTQLLGQPGAKNRS